jgi:hypothetical protein
MVRDHVAFMHDLWGCSVINFKEAWLQFVYSVTCMWASVSIAACTSLNPQRVLQHCNKMFSHNDSDDHFALLLTCIPCCFLLCIICNCLENMPVALINQHVQHQLCLSVARHLLGVMYSSIAVWALSQYTGYTVRVIHCDDAGSTLSTIAWLQHRCYWEEAFWWQPCYNIGCSASDRRPLACASIKSQALINVL